jgi:hypothetical protein
VEGGDLGGGVEGGGGAATGGMVGGGGEQEGAASYRMVVCYACLAPGFFSKSMKLLGRCGVVGGQSSNRWGL